MKRALSIVFILSLCLSLYACAKPAQEQPAGDNSWARIEEQGYFILGLDDSFPPMGFRDDNNEIVGFDIDMAKAAAEYLGVEVQIKPVVWDTVILSLTDGEIDCIWNGMSVTPARLEKINISKPYVNSDQIVVTLSETAIGSFADLSGKIIGTQMASSSIDALDNAPEVRDSFAELKEYATFTEAMMDLDSKRVDAVVIDGIAFYGDFVVKSPGKYKALEETFDTEEMAIGVRKEDNAFREKLNEAFDALRANGKAKQISEKWFGEDILLF